MDIDINPFIQIDLIVIIKEFIFTLVFNRLKNFVMGILGIRLRRTCRLQLLWALDNKNPHKESLWTLYADFLFHMTDRHVFM